MSYLLFMDESGHHGGAGYEVRGGIALPVRSVWQFTRRMRGIEARCFGDLLSKHGTELKATKLLERDRVRKASMRPDLADAERQRLCLEYLGQKRNSTKATLEHNIAYAQAGCLFVTRLLQLVRDEGGLAFASIVPADHTKPTTSISRTYVRRDICYLMERFFYFLEERGDSGVLVLDETDRSDDRRFLQRLERYFSSHDQGKAHSRLILPTPLFTESAMSYPIQAADVICYLISQGFRLQSMDIPARPDFRQTWLDLLGALRFQCNRETRAGGVRVMHSFVYVKDPWKGSRGRRQDTPAERP
ncbi:MAG: hypothetical protein AMXMBFR81_21360 [Chthonomonas sp.]